MLPIRTKIMDVVPNYSRNLFICFHGFALDQITSEVSNTSITKDAVKTYELSTINLS